MHAPVDVGDAERLSRNKAAYARFIGILNAQHFEALPEVVHPDRYREICVGFTPGWVNLTDAVTSLRRVLVGIPDLRAEILDTAAEGDQVYARLKVRGTNAGRLFGAPATGRSYEVDMFDYARFDDGRIVERVQQSDTFGQMRQLFGGVLKWAAIGLAAVLVGCVIAVAL